MTISTWTITCEQDEDGITVLPIPEDMMSSLGWQEGDDLEFVVNNDNTCTIVNLSCKQRDSDMPGNIA